MIRVAPFLAICFAMLAGVNSDAERGGELNSRVATLDAQPHQIGVATLSPPLSEPAVLAVDTDDAKSAALGSKPVLRSIETPAAAAQIPPGGFAIAQQRMVFNANANLNGFSLQTASIRLQV